MPMHRLHQEIHPSCWGVTLSDLRLFEREVQRLWEEGSILDHEDFPNELHDDPTIGPNIYQVNEHYIKPVTQLAGGMSWALMMNPRGLRCDVFVTHCWAEGIFEICSKIRRNWPRDGKNLWCCFLANPQNANVSELLGTDPMSSPFAQALTTCRHFLVVPNSRVSIYSRLWCVFEAHVALERGIPISLPWQPHAQKAVRLSAGWILLWILAVLFGYYRIPGEWSMWFMEEIYCWVVVLGSVILLFDHVHDSTSILALYARALSVGILSGMVLLGEVEEEGFRAGHARFVLITPISVGWLYGNMHAMITQTLAVEGSQLNFGSVRKARCTCVRDEVAIRGAIAGAEDEIDTAISALMIVGSYDPEVKKNLMRGLSPQRIKRGTRWGMVISYSTYVAVAPFGCLMESEASVAYLVTASCALLCLCVWFCPRAKSETMMFAGDVVIGAGLSLYTIHESWSFAVAGQWSNPLQCSVVSVGAHFTMLALVFLGAVAALVLFYTGRLSRRGGRRRCLRADAKADGDDEETGSEGLSITGGCPDSEEDGGSRETEEEKTRRCLRCTACS